MNINYPHRQKRVTRLDASVLATHRETALLRTLPQNYRVTMQKQVCHRNRRKFLAWLSISKDLWMKIALRSTNISKIQKKSQRHDVMGTSGI